MTMVAAWPSGVSSGSDDHGKKQGKDVGLLEDRSEAEHYVAGCDGDECQADKPYDPPAVVHGGAGVQIGELEVFAADTRQFFNILSGLLLHDLEGVIVSDHTEQVVKFIDNRKHHEIVSGEEAGGVFLIGGGEDEFVDVVGDVADGRVPGVEGQIAEADFAD